MQLTKVSAKTRSYQSRKLLHAAIRRADPFHVAGSDRAVAVRYGANRPARTVWLVLGPGDGGTGVFSPGTYHFDTALALTFSK